MKGHVHLAFILALVFTGCVSNPSNARLLSKEELQKKFEDNAHLTVYWQYMGDQDDFHFVRLVSPVGQKIYRVRSNDFPIADVFTLTTNPANWLMLGPDGRTAPMKP